MPWCPNCNMEYDEGETVCKGCGLALTEETSENNTFEAESVNEDSIEITVNDGTVSDKLVSDEYLSNELESGETTSDELESGETASDEVASDKTVEQSEDVDSSIQEDAQSEDVDSSIEEDTQYEDVDSSIEEDTQSEESPIEYEESEEEEPLTESEEKELINSIKNPITSSTYIKKEEQYKDLISSAYSFIIVAILGLGVLVINALGIINVFSGALFYTVMGALFVAFLYVGITSFIKSKKIEQDIGKENQVTEAINQWLSENITEEQLDSYVNPDDSEEIQFMHKLEKMKELVISSFGELDDLYLDRLVEEFYNNNLE